MNHFDVDSIIKKVKKMSDDEVLEAIIEMQIELDHKLMKKLRNIVTQMMVEDV